MARRTDHAEVSSLRAVAHPVRLRILSLLTGAPMSAAEVARELAITHANASYHLRLLAGAELVVVAGQEKIRGGVAKRYRHPWDLGARATRGASPGSGEADGALVVRAVADELVRRHAVRRKGGPVLLADAELWLEPEVWAEANRLVTEASRLVHANARRPRTEGTLHVNLTAVAFEIEDRASRRVGEPSPAQRDGSAT